MLGAEPGARRALGRAAQVGLEQVRHAQVRLAQLRHPRGKSGAGGAGGGDPAMDQQNAGVPREGMSQYRAR